MLHPQESGEMKDWQKDSDPLKSPCILKITQICSVDKRN